MGADGEEEMIARLQARTRGIPVVATCAAVVDALRTLGADRIALVDPPWFDAELSDLGRRYYESAGFAVVHSAPCGLPSDQNAITPAALYAWVSDRAPAEADAIVVGGNGFRAVGAIAALEQHLQRPVVTANQALLWAALSRRRGEHRRGQRLWPPLQNPTACRMSTTWMRPGSSWWISRIFPT
jgi:maleate isomerase